MPCEIAISTPDIYVKIWKHISMQKNGTQIIVPGSIINNNKQVEIDHMSLKKNGFKRCGIPIQWKIS